jgi:hypothetical protein
VTTTTPGMQLPPGGQPRLAAGSWRVDPAQSHGSPCIVITSSWVIDSEWVTRQWIPGLGRRIVMTCSCSLEPDM